MKKVYGVGVNDAEYEVIKRVTEGGKRKVVFECPFYKRWTTMLSRCYKPKKDCYTDVTVCDEWLTFSNFRDWMEKQDWQGKELDKDLLSKGSCVKIYSPDTCLFIHSSVNQFIRVRDNKTKTKTGMFLDKYGKYFVQCRNPFTGKKDYLGRFDCEDIAHETWRSYKHQLAVRMANDTSYVNDERVREALVNYFS